MNKYKTIVLSDIHLGSYGSGAKKALEFIKKNTCDVLILNGDIVDGWSLKRGGSWSEDDTKFIRHILKITYKKGTQIYYVRGNHDDFLDSLIPIKIGRIKVVKDLVLKSGDKKFFITHGDMFDLITTNSKFISKIGSILYDFLLWINKKYNWFRVLFGKEYYSLSKEIKNRVKVAVNYMSNFENQLCQFANIKECDGIICGHIHQPKIKQIENITYMNSGDWVENMSALVETHENHWEIVFNNS